MEIGQRLAVWLNDDDAKRLLGATDQSEKSRWTVICTVAHADPTQIGIWVDVEYVLERRPQPEKREPKRVAWKVNPARCLIRCYYIYSAAAV